MPNASRNTSEAVIILILQILACIAMLTGAVGLVLGPVTGTGLQTITVTTTANLDSSAVSDSQPVWF